MTICDLSQFFGASGGGIRTYLEAKRSAIARSTDWRYVLISPGAHDREERGERWVRHEVGSPSFPGRGAYRLLYRIDRVLELLRRIEPDIIEVDSPYHLPWVARWDQRRRRSQDAGRGTTGAGVVAYHHADFPRAYVESACARWFGPQVAARARRLALGYARRVYGACDLVLTGSAALTRELRGVGVERIETLPLGVDLELFHPSRRDRVLRQELGVARGTRLLVYVGRFDEEKRVRVVLDAFRQLAPTNDVRLVLAGSGPLRKLLLQAQSEDPRVHVLPFVHDRAQLARLLASADVYITAGPHETFGLSILEAQASGLPIVGVRAGALLDRVGPDVGALAEVDSSDDLARCCHVIFARDPAASRRASRAAAERGGGWPATFDTLFGHYERLARLLRTSPSSARPALRTTASESP